MKNEPRQNSFPKNERLSLKKEIDLLYEKGHSFVAFPLRVVYLTEKEAKEPGVSLMLCVPKKKVRKAVNRNRIKRLMKETYRVRKHDLSAQMTDRAQRLLLSFHYLDKAQNTYPEMEAAMHKALAILLNRA
jgi:ribonuclease P protein component